MRLLWWIIYWVKVKFMIFIAVLICFIISRVFHKKLNFFYVLAAIATITASIYIGISTFSDLDFSHPVLIFIGAIISSIIIDICYLMMIPTRGKESGESAEDV